MAQNAIADINPHKSNDAFRTISEVSHELGVAQHVLRFWESKFSQIRPMKRAGGRRYYRPEDVALLQRIHQLLYAEGYTIPGAQKALKGVHKTQLRAVQPPAPALPAKVVDRLSERQKDLLQATLAELIEMKALLTPSDN